MKIDWFTVAAQFINFLLLVWLLKKFLFKPILHAVETREQKIRNQVEDAEKIKVQAEDQRNAFIRKQELFEAERTGLMNKALEEIRDEREKLLSEARMEADELIAAKARNYDESMAQQRDNLERSAHENLILAADKVLADLADISLQEKIEAVFIRRLHAMNEQEKQAFIKAFSQDQGSIRVFSAFEMSDSGRNEMNRIIGSILSSDVQVTFEEQPELKGGIVLETDGFRLAWNISDYLQHLHAHLQNKDEAFNDSAQL